MKTILRSIVLLCCFALFMVACKKSSGGGGGGDTSGVEENLAISVNPAPSTPTTPIKATGPTYTFSVIINSKMPANGVEVKVKYTRDSDGTVIGTNDYTTTASFANIPFNITNIPMNEMGTVTITVISKSKPSNIATTSFKLVRK